MNATTVTWDNGTMSGSREFPSQFLAKRFAEGLERTGYTVTMDAPAAAPAPEAPKAEQTGRVGKGLAVHRLIDGNAHCGSSYRKGLGANLKTVTTGEQITCSHCLKG